MTESALKEANKIAKILCNKFGEKEVILYGSILKNKFNSSSDIDFAVKGSILHDFYNSIERIFELISNYIDGSSINLKNLLLRIIGDSPKLLNVQNVPIIIIM